MFVKSSAMSSIDAQLDQLKAGLDQLEAGIDRLEAALIEDRELHSFGHRIVYDRATGHGRNVFGCKIDISKLDERGYRVKL